jgi:6,7-dimethyl-8-ribityllumazine synthase
MATIDKNLSEFKPEEIPNGADFKIGIVVSEWNDEITKGLLSGAHEIFGKANVKKENIHLIWVPGAFELPLGAKYLLDADLNLDGVIVIGCVIQGETKHFDFVCDGVTQGISRLNLDYTKPVSFCVLTDNTKQQSIDRSGGKHGNKGIECGLTLLKMIDIKKRM